MSEKGWLHRWIHHKYIKALEKAFSIMTHGQKQEMREWSRKNQ